jgi:hypothetical protein
MRALLDVTVLIALLDQDHAMHERARNWFAVNVRPGWASCPITQNGCVRIISMIASSPRPASTIIQRTLTERPDCEAGEAALPTSPARAARCSVDAVVQGSACGTETIPAAIRRKLGRAPELMELAETSPTGKARLLRKKARRLLGQAGTSALRASRGKKPKLSGACATAIKETTDRLAAAG